MIWASANQGRVFKFCRSLTLVTWHVFFYKITTSLRNHCRIWLLQSLCNSPLTHRFLVSAMKVKIFSPFPYILLQFKNGGLCKWEYMDGIPLENWVHKVHSMLHTKALENRWVFMPDPGTPYPAGLLEGLNQFPPRTTDSPMKPFFIEMPIWADNLGR